MTKKTDKIKVLELSNIDLLGRRFDGYDLAESLKRSPSIDIKMAVNNRLSFCSRARNLFRSAYVEECDFIVQNAERRYLGTKNQLSLAHNALVENDFYRCANILHFHLYHNMNLPIEFLTEIPEEKKIIIEIHDTFWLTDNEIPMLEVFNYTDINKQSLNAERKRVLNSIDAEFVVHSPYMLRLFKESETTRKIKNVRLINFGVDTKTFHPLSDKKKINIRKKLGIPEGNIVLFARAQKEFKGTDFIVKALEGIKTNKKITILSVVNKNMFDSLRGKFQVVDAGVVYDDKRMNELFNVADIFLSPSTEESFGFMATEAMACEKPVIVFEGTALPDTVCAPEIGIATKRNAAALRSAILKLINGADERERRGKLGRDFVINNYKPEKYVQDYANLFTELGKKAKRETVSSSKKTKRAINTDAPCEFTDLLRRIRSEIINQTQEDLEDYQYPVFDYNDAGIQDSLRRLNKDIFNEIKSSARRHHIMYNIKRKLPAPLKSGTKKLLQKIVAKVRLIFPKCIRSKVKQLLIK